MTVSPQKAASAEKPPSEWMAHLCVGYDFAAWLRTLHQGRYRVSPKNFHVAVLATYISFGHTILRYVQNALHGERIGRTPVVSPVFILGHWRTGTTLLHELLIRDPRHTFPNTYQCLDPNHAMLTEGFAKKYLRWLLPKHRPMDRMQFGWERPQECEFALCLLGAASTYSTMNFPNAGTIEPDALELDRLPAWRQRQWRTLFRRLLQTIVANDPRRPVLKSPTHTCRIPTLLEMFPDAKFLYLKRDPYVVYPSTVNLWKKLHEKQGLHAPHHKDVEETVLKTFARMHARVEATKSQVPAGNWFELKYEDLTARPEGLLEELYAALDLGDFEPVRPGIREYLATNRNYEKNRWTLPPETRALVKDRWGDVIEAWGY
jgi:omega-hydroxy-beta-dihydromenaquinone-9 sulfotransferase